MSNYQVIPYNDGWKVVGSSNQTDRIVYKTKQIALQEAGRMARMNNKPVIVHARNGKVTVARSAKTHIKSANVKHNFSNKEVRNSIAEAMVLRERNKR